MPFKIRFIYSLLEFLGVKAGDNYTRFGEKTLVCDDVLQHAKADGFFKKEVRAILQGFIF